MPGFPKPSEQTFRSQVIAMTGSSCRRLLAVFSLIFVVAVFLHGQDVPADRPGVLPPILASPHYVGIPEPPVAPKPVSPPHIVFQKIVQTAGIIFSGQVTFVEHSASFAGPDAASTTVTFQVEHAMLGVSPGQTLTIHEWAGLWSRGERYRVGEHVLLFLYPPSKLGLTSPVAGPVGRFAISPQGNILLNAQNAAAMAGNLIIGGRSSIPYADFAKVVQRSSGEE